jgi:hypothetical protein
MPLSLCSWPLAGLPGGADGWHLRFALCGGGGPPAAGIVYCGLWLWVAGCTTGLHNAQQLQLGCSGLWLVCEPVSRARACRVYLVLRLAWRVARISCLVYCVWCVVARGGGGGGSGSGSGRAVCYCAMCC